MSFTVTAIMPIRNARDTVFGSLTSLARGAGTVRMRLLLCDNGSTDGSARLIERSATQIWLRHMGIVETRVLAPVPDKRGRPEFRGDPVLAQNKNLEHLIAKFVWEVSQDPTPYIFRLDADVRMPPASMADLVGRMNQDEELGILGIEYPPKSDHVQGGCTMYRTSMMEAMAKDGFGTDGCTCRWLHKEAERRGFKVEHFGGLVAEHTKVRG